MVEGVIDGTIDYRKDVNLHETTSEAFYYASFVLRCIWGEHLQFCSIDDHLIIFAVTILAHVLMDHFRCI